MLRAHTNTVSYRVVYVDTRHPTYHTIQNPTYDVSSPSSSLRYPLPRVRSRQRTSCPNSPRDDPAGARLCGISSIMMASFRRHRKATTTPFQFHSPKFYSRRFTHLFLWLFHGPMTPATREMRIVSYDVEDGRCAIRETSEREDEEITV